MDSSTFYLHAKDIEKEQLKNLISFINTISSYNEKLKRCRSQEKKLEILHHISRCSDAIQHLSGKVVTLNEAFDSLV